MPIVVGCEFDGIRPGGCASKVECWETVDAGTLLQNSGLSGTFGRGERGAEAPLYPHNADTAIVEPL